MWGVTSLNPIVVAVTGRTIHKRVTPFTAIGDGFAVHAASGSCGNVTDAHTLWRRHATNPPGPCGGAPRDVMVAYSTCRNGLHADVGPARAYDVADQLSRGLELYAASDLCSWRLLPRAARVSTWVSNAVGGWRDVRRRSDSLGFCGAGTRTRTENLLITNPKAGRPTVCRPAVSVGNEGVRVRVVRALLLVSVG